MSEDDSEQNINVPTLGGRDESATASAADNHEQNTSVLTSNGRGEDISITVSGSANPPSPSGPGENVNVTVSGNAYPPSPSGPGVTVNVMDNAERDAYLPPTRSPEQKTAILCQMVDVPTMVHSQYQQYDCTVVLHEPVHAFVPSGSTTSTPEYVVARGQLLLRYNKN